MSRLLGFLLAPTPPSRRAGLLSAIAGVALCTLIVYPLKQIAPVVSLGVVYLLAVLVVSLTWGAWLGAFTGLLSAAAFNFFQLPPVGRFTVKDPDNWVALGAFLVVAALTSSVAEVTRARAREALERRREADLATEMARLLLRGESLVEVLPTAAARMAQALELPSAAIAMETVEPDARSVAFPLREGDRRLGTLVVGAETSERNLHRLQERVVPALEALLSAALEREALQAGVVETAALRQADVVKTALLRAVSHDLRSPLTAISAAGEAIALPGISADEREELASVIVGETRRLSRLVENLLDLSRLEAGALELRSEEVDLAEIVQLVSAEFIPALAQHDSELRRRVAPAPVVACDPERVAQILRILIDNAIAHTPRGTGIVISIAAAERETRLAVRDFGPGISATERERIFEPFYTSDEGQGSGLGLAIAHELAERMGGALTVESTPGRTVFTLTLPR